MTLSSSTVLVFCSRLGASAGRFRGFATAALPSEGLRRLNCDKFLSDIFDVMQHELKPFLYREDRNVHRQAIIESHLNTFQEALFQFRCILDIQSLAVSCHRLGQLVPLIRPRHPELWMFPRLKSTLPLLCTEIPKQIEQADANQLMKIFWGISRMGNSILWKPSASWIYELQTLLIASNEFGGNNACNMIEAMSNFGFPLDAGMQQIILRDAIYDFKDPSTSPFNLLYFLEAIAKNRYPPRWNIKIWSAQEMWNDDLVALAHSLTKLRIEAMEIRPILAKLYILAQERDPPLSTQQIREFTKSYQIIGYIFDRPIVSPFHL